MQNDYTSEIEFDRAVLYILNQHRGHGNAIPRWSLVERVFGPEAVAAPIRNNNNVYDRQVRDSIERWRATGQHICNLGDGGYFMAASREEYEEFKRYYLGAAYRKLQITSAMDDAANRRWGLVPKVSDPKQAVLFGG